MGLHFLNLNTNIIFTSRLGCDEPMALIPTKFTDRSRVNGILHRPSTSGMEESLKSCIRHSKVTKATKNYLTLNASVCDE
jgi:hypothetical protein